VGMRVTVAQLCFEGKNQDETFALRGPEVVFSRCAASIIALTDLKEDFFKCSLWCFTYVSVLTYTQQPIYLLGRSAMNIWQCPSGRTCAST